MQPFRSGSGFQFSLPHPTCLPTVPHCRPGQRLHCVDTGLSQQAVAGLEEGRAIAGSGLGVISPCTLQSTSEQEAQSLALTQCRGPQAHLQSYLGPHLGLAWTWKARVRCGRKCLGKLLMPCSLGLGMGFPSSERH